MRESAYRNPFSDFSSQGKVYLVIQPDAAGNVIKFSISQQNVFSALLMFSGKFKKLEFYSNLYINNV